MRTTALANPVALNAPYSLFGDTAKIRPDPSVECTDENLPKLIAWRFHYGAKSAPLSQSIVPRRPFPPEHVDEKQSKRQRYSDKSEYKPATVALRHPRSTIILPLSHNQRPSLSPGWAVDLRCYKT